jgi:hypothetical protein
METGRVRSGRWRDMAEEARTIAAEIGDNDLGRAVLETAISYEEFARFYHAVWMAPVTNPQLYLRLNMPMNWHAFLWRGLSDQARIAARKLRSKRLKAQIITLAARYTAMALWAERPERDKKNGKAK